jgi:hypothetical protein
MLGGPSVNPFFDQLHHFADRCVQATSMLKCMLVLDFVVGSADR